MRALSLDGRLGKYTTRPRPRGEDDIRRREGMRLGCGFVGVGEAVDAGGGVVEGCDGAEDDVDACFGGEGRHGGCELEGVDLGCGGGGAHFRIGCDRVCVEPVEVRGDSVLRLLPVCCAPAFEFGEFLPFFFISFDGCGSVRFIVEVPPFGSDGAGV